MLPIENSSPAEELADELADVPVELKPAPVEVIAAVVERNGRYLICQRPLHKRHGGLWEFPGGKVEPGETFFQAASRELSEELALQVTSVGAVRFAQRDFDSPFQISFVDVSAAGEPVLHEHCALNWLTIDELLHVDLAPADRQYVQVLFSLKL